jgi:protein ImuA
MSSACRQVVESLEVKISRLQKARTSQYGCVTTGNSGFDRLLPDRGLRRGTLVEWVAQPAAGAATLALVAARHACGEEGILVVLDRWRRFYPPAAAHLGIDLKRMILVRTANARDHLWGLTQILHSPGVAAVLAWPEKLNDRAWRRLQLAAEQSGTLGLFIQPPSVLSRPTWADLRLLVEPRPCQSDHRRWCIELLRSRGRYKTLSKIELELDDETGVLQTARPVRLDSTLATTAINKRSRQA